jgi:hypothetical protein
MSRFSIPLPRTLVFLSVGLMAMFWLLMPRDVGEGAAIIVMVARGILSFIVAVMYAWSIKTVWGDKTADASHALIMGICLAFAADAFGSIMSITWRIQGMPDTWRGLAVWYFPSYVTSIAAIMHISAPGAIQGRIPKRNVIVISTAMVLSAFVAGLLIGAQIGVLSL